MAIYVDINAITPTDIESVYDGEAIHQSIIHILSTQIGERIFNPEFGNSLNDYLFEFMDDLTALEVLNILKRAIDKYEKRVTMNTGQTEIIPIPEENRYEISLVLDINGAEGQSFVFEGSLSR